MPGPRVGGGGCLVLGVSTLGVSGPRGVSVPGGCLVPGGGGIPACTEADPPCEQNS